MKNELDERQLYLRGKIFRNIIVIFIVYLLVDALLESQGITLVEGIWGNITIVVLTSAYGIIAMILKDVVDLDERSNRFLYGVFGVIGLFLFVMWIIEGVVLQEISFLNGGSISQEGARFLFSIAWIIIGISFVYKLRSAKEL